MVDDVNGGWWQWKPFYEVDIIRNWLPTKKSTYLCNQVEIANQNKYAVIALWLGIY